MVSQTRVTARAKQWEMRKTQPQTLCPQSPCPFQCLWHTAHREVPDGATLRAGWGEDEPSGDPPPLSSSGSEGHLVPVLWSEGQGFSPRFCCQHLLPTSMLGTLIWLKPDDEKGRKEKEKQEIYPQTSWSSRLVPFSHLPASVRLSGVFRLKILSREVSCL